LEIERHEKISNIPKRKEKEEKKVYILVYSTFSNNLILTNYIIKFDDKDENNF
jgi:hypothetical protein